MFERDRPNTGAAALGSTKGSSCVNRLDQEVVCVRQPMTVVLTDNGDVGRLLLCSAVSNSRGLNCVQGEGSIAGHVAGSHRDV